MVSQTHLINPHPLSTDSKNFMGRLFLIDAMISGGQSRVKPYSCRLAQLRKFPTFSFLWLGLFFWTAGDTLALHMWIDTIFRETWEQIINVGVFDWARKRLLAAGPLRLKQRLVVHLCICANGHTGNVVDITRFFVCFWVSSYFPGGQTKGNKAFLWRLEPPPCHRWVTLYFIFRLPKGAGRQRIICFQR